jgi:hypothetical protein
MRRAFGFFMTGSLAFLVVTVLSRSARAQEGERLESLQVEETSAEEIEPQVVGARRQPNPWFVVTVEGPAACTGTIYKRRWILTAAHCIPAAWDKNGSGVIGDAVGENPGQLKMDGGPNLSGRNVRRTAVSIRKHPQAQWGQAAGTSDTALIKVNGDFFPEVVPTWNLYYTLNSSGLPVLNLDLWPTSTLEPTSIVTVYGYSTVWLGFADAVVTGNFGNWFATGLLNDQGVCQFGDSGGPAFYWGAGERFYHVGITSTTDNATFCGHIGTNFIKPWVEKIAGR